MYVCMYVCIAKLYQSDCIVLCVHHIQQLTTTKVKVDRVQVVGASSTTFAVCLDQDEKKILQSVTR